MPAASRLWLKTGENRSSGWVNLCGCGWSGPGWRRSIDLTSSCGTARQYHGMAGSVRQQVCGAKRFFRQILSGGNGELRHLFCAIISALGRAAVVHFGGDSVWSAGLISFCIRTKGAVPWVPQRCRWHQACRCGCCYRTIWGGPSGGRGRAKRGRG